jgi:hypothetical protein
LKKEIIERTETTRPVRFKKRLEDQGRYQGEARTNKRAKPSRIHTAPHQYDENKNNQPISRFSKKRNHQDHWSAKKTDKETSSTRGDYAKKERVKSDTRPFNKRQSKDKYQGKSSAHNKSQQDFKKRFNNKTHDRQSSNDRTVTGDRYR